MLLGITVIDLISACLYENLFQLGVIQTGSKSNASNKLGHLAYFSFVIVEIYILIALIKIRHIYHFCNEHSAPSMHQIQQPNQTTSNHTHNGSSHCCKTVVNFCKNIL